MRNASGKLKKPSGAPGKRCYAVGDVHGRLDLLQELLDRIALHDAERPPRDTAIVLLGDLIDRGPKSSEVVEFVRTFRPSRGRLYVLLGNHEELMLRALDGDLEAFNSWMINGGVATMRSYGVDTTNLEGLELEDFRRRVASKIPPSHVSFLKAAADSIRFGDYFLVHAGIRPGRNLEEQLATDLRWIRGAFLRSEADHGVVVVHGHSQTAQIEERPNRIGVDTGAYHSGVLTAAWFEGSEQGFIQTSGPEMDSRADSLF
jgi:serine/threonine protein phosphatase 1